MASWLGANPSLDEVAIKAPCCQDALVAARDESYSWSPEIPANAFKRPRFAHDARQKVQGAKRLAISGVYRLSINGSEGLASWSHPSVHQEALIEGALVKARYAGQSVASARSRCNGLVRSRGFHPWHTPHQKYGMSQSINRKLLRQQLFCEMLCCSNTKHRAVAQRLRAGAGHASIDIPRSHQEPANLAGLRVMQRGAQLLHPDPDLVTNFHFAPLCCVCC